MSLNTAPQFFIQCSLNMDTYWNMRLIQPTTPDQPLDDKGEVERGNELSRSTKGASIRARENVQFSSVAQSCPTLCNPMNCSTPGLPVHHQLPESTQTHVHRVGDAIQPSHPLVFPFSSCPQSFPASGSLQMSQLFASGGQSIGVSASTLVLPMNTQD